MKTNLSTKASEEARRHSGRGSSSGRGGITRSEGISLEDAEK